MEKQLLVPVNDDAGSSTSLQFIKNFFRHLESIRLTLFYVCPKQACWKEGYNDPYDDSPEPDLAAQTKGCNILQKALEYALEIGFSTQNVETKLSVARESVPSEIVVESKNGLYDAIVICHRTLAWFNQLFEDSTTYRLLWESLSCPLWVCRHNVDPERKNVLLCVEGSRQAVRMADHVGFILRDETEHSITILHVQEESSPAEDRSKEILEESKAIILENGVSPERVNTRLVNSKNPAQAILHELKENKYAVVSIGRTGRKPKGFSIIFGTTCLRLLRGVEDASLWISK